MSFRMLFENWKQLIETGSQELYQEFPQLSHYFDRLGETTQDIEHHPEGNALQHTALTVQRAKEIANREKFNEDEREILILAALCHDFGKISKTQVDPDGKVTSYGHDDESAEMVPEVLQILGKEKYVPFVQPLVRYHMYYVFVKPEDFSKKIVRRLKKRLEPASLQMLAAVTEADYSARGPKPTGQPMQMWLDADVDEPRPVTLAISGKDVIKQFNLQPGPGIGQALEMAKKAVETGEVGNDREALLQYLGTIL